MKKPNIIALPTSQMMSFCDILGLTKVDQSSEKAMIEALEATDFRKLKRVDPGAGPRPENGVGFDPDDMGEEVVARRKVALGRV